MAAVGLGHLGPGRVDTHYQRCPLPSRETGKLAFAGPYVKHSVVAGQKLSGQRVDLLGVLRVGSVGELRLPPIGVTLPQILIDKGRVSGLFGMLGGHCGP